MIWHYVIYFHHQTSFKILSYLVIGTHSGTQEIILQEQMVDEEPFFTVTIP
jgi:hypothetical protein